MLCEFGGPRNWPNNKEFDRKIRISRLQSPKHRSVTSSNRDRSTSEDTMQFYRVVAFDAGCYDVLIERTSEEKSLDESRTANGESSHE